MEGVPEAATTHQGVPGASGVPWCLVGRLSLLLVTSLAHWLLFGPKKISKKFRRDWTPFGTDILRSKNKQKKQQLALGTMSIG